MSGVTSLSLGDKRRDGREIRMSAEKRHGLVLDAQALHELEAEQRIHEERLAAIWQLSPEVWQGELKLEDARHFDRLKQVYSAFADRTMQ